MTSVLDERATGGETVVPGLRTRGRKVKKLAATAIVVPVALFAAVYVLFFTPGSPPALRLSAPSAGPDIGVPTGLWRVGSGSVAGYRVREKLVRLPASNEAVGRTQAITGAFRLSGDRAGVRIERGMRIDVDVSTLKSDAARRDDHMRTIAIETDKFPTATFVTTADVIVPDAVAGRGQADVTAEGDLTLHGVTRIFQIPVRTQRTGGRIEVVGTFSFGWDLFQMEQPNLSYVTVESDPTLEFQLFFDHESARSVSDLPALGAE